MRCDYSLLVMVHFCLSYQASQFCQIARGSEAVPATVAVLQGKRGRGECPPVLDLCAEGKSLPNGPRWILLIILLAVASAAMASPECPNLSGNYMIQGEDGQVHIAIEQHECDRINIVRKSGYLGKITSETHILKLDGKDQKDLSWLGGREQYMTSAKFVGSELQIKARTAGGSTLTMIYSLTPGGDLLEEAVTDRRGVPVVAKRQK